MCPWAALPGEQPTLPMEPSLPFLPRKPSRSRLPLRAPSWLCMQSGASGRFKSKSVSLPGWERTGHGEK